MIVVDASVILHALLEGPKDRDFLDRLQNEGELFAPEVIYLEVSSGMRRQVRLKQLSQDHARAAIQDLQAYPINIKSISNLVERIWDIRDNFTSYDASYIVLAECLRMPFLTRDQKLAAAVRAHTKVELI